MATPRELLSRSVELVKDAYKDSKKNPDNAEITNALMELREHLQVIREAFVDLKAGVNTAVPVVPGAFAGRCLGR